MEFHPEKISRRDFVASVGAAGALSARIASALHLGTINLPIPEESGIDHIVLVMMENRSFDYFLGWLPGERMDARQDFGIPMSPGNSSQRMNVLRKPF
jgi:phospholipase C